MKAMILAAGLGTRLRPLTQTLPKPLLPIAGRPLIEWIVLLLRQHGITEVIINLHHLGDSIEQALGDGARWGMRVSYSREAVILGTGGGLKEAEPFFEGRPFLVLNGDTVMDLDVGKLLRFHRERGGLATMVLREDPQSEQWGIVEVDEQQRVLRINGRGRSGHSPAGRRMFAGVHVMSPELLHEVPRGRESSIIEAYVQELGRGALVLGYELSGYWSDIGTPERYEQVRRDAEAGKIAFLMKRLD